MTCDGWASESQYLFRNQNQMAKINSERARRGPTHTDRVEIALTSSEIASSQDPDHTALIYRKAMPWLNEQAFTSIPESLGSTIESKARDIFYSEWILHPSNHGSSPGYMDILPEMEALAESSSALHFAVEALTFANIQTLVYRDVEGG